MAHRSHSEIQKMFQQFLILKIQGIVHIVVCLGKIFWSLKLVAYLQIMAIKSRDNIQGSLCKHRYSSITKWDSFKSPANKVFHILWACWWQNWYFSERKPSPLKPVVSNCGQFCVKKDAKNNNKLAILGSWYNIRIMLGFFCLKCVLKLFTSRNCEN